MRYLAAIIPFCLSMSAMADTLYSLDLNSNRIVTVNTLNGDVTHVSPIEGVGFDATGQVDLTYANGFIYAVDYGFDFTSPSILYKISPQTGRIVALPKIIFRPNGESPNVTDGIATGPNGELIVSYRAYSPDTAYSDGLGIVNPNSGQITSEHSFEVEGFFNPDIDALGSDLNGVLWGMDVNNEVGYRELIQLSITPPVYDIVGAFPDSNSAANDIAFIPSGLYSVRASGSMQIHNPATGQATGSVFYDAGYVLNGLAYIPVPGPAAICLLCLAGLHGVTRPRQR